MKLFYAIKEIIMDMGKKPRKYLPEVNSSFREKSLVITPPVIREASGIKVHNRRIKSFLFSTDVATIAYADADAILAVYPQSPHPSIIEAITNVSSQPVFAGVGGGVTSGMRSAFVAHFAEAKGVLGIVVNSPTPIETISLLDESVDCPIIITVSSFYEDVEGKIEAGGDILNVANGQKTPELVRYLRAKYPEFPIIATGGPNDETILEAIHAGANAISWKPPTNAELFAEKMTVYRKISRKDYMDSHEGMTLYEFEAQENS